MCEPASEHQICMDLSLKWVQISFKIYSVCAFNFSFALVLLSHSRRIRLASQIVRKKNWVKNGPNELHQSNDRQCSKPPNQSRASPSHFKLDSQTEYEVVTWWWLRISPRKRAIENSGGGAFEPNQMEQSGAEV